MTTGWLLLLLLIVSSQSVDSQSTTDDETCGEGGLLRRILDNQQQILQILQQHQTILNNLGKSLFPPGSVLNVVITFQVSGLLLDADSTTCLILGKIIMSFTFTTSIHDFPFKHIGLRIACNVKSLRNCCSARNDKSWG